MKPGRIFVALAAVVGLLLIGAPSASAGPDLSGRWMSDSLRDNRIGYFLVLRPAPTSGSGYVGHLRFERQSGAREVRMPVKATVAGTRVIISARKGTFDRAGRTLIGRMDGQGVLVLTNCLDRLRQVMSWDLGSDCTLRLRR